MYEGKGTIHTKGKSMSVLAGKCWGGGGTVNVSNKSSCPPTHPVIIELGQPLRRLLFRVRTFTPEITLERSRSWDQNR